MIGFFVVVVVVSFLVVIVGIVAFEVESAGWGWTVVAGEAAAVPFTAALALAGFGLLIIGLVVVAAMAAAKTTKIISKTW